MDSERRERVFVIRMWNDGDAAVRETWRGSIRDVASGRKRYVTSALEIAEFVALRLATIDDASEP